MMLSFAGVPVPLGSQFRWIFQFRWLFQAAGYSGAPNLAFPTTLSSVGFSGSLEARDSFHVLGEW